MVGIRQVDLTWQQAADLRDDTIGLIGVGSIEQHGPHLPVEMDTVATTALLTAVADRTPAPVVIAPVVPVGLSDHHLAFPGTVSIDRATLTGILDAQVASFERMGIDRIAIITGHGGNFAFIGEYAASVTARGDTRVIAYDRLWDFIDVSVEAARRHGVEPPATDGHAGVVETSLALHLIPERVSDFSDVRGYVAAEEGWQERLFEGVHVFSEIGVLGDPAGSTAAIGQEVLESLAAELGDWLSQSFDL